MKNQFQLLGYGCLFSRTRTSVYGFPSDKKLSNKKEHGSGLICQNAEPSYFIVLSELLRHSCMKRMM